MKKTKILLIASLVIGIAIGITSNSVYANSGISVILDGSEIQFEDQGPIFVEGQVFVPIRDIFTQMGYDVSWDPGTRTATLINTYVSIVIPAMGSHFYVNNEVVTPVIPQLLRSGRLLLPIETIVNVVGATFVWDEAMKTVAITTTFDLGSNQEECNGVLCEGNDNAITENVVTSDMLRFKYEYEALNDQPNAAGTRIFKPLAIPEFNLISYATPEQILEIAESGTGLILFGFPQCPWCRQMTPLLIDVALEKGIDVIHYIDMTTIRTTWALQDGTPVMTDPGHPRYQDMLTAFESVIEPMDLNPFHLTDADGNSVNTYELRIFVPTLIAIRDGGIVASHVYTVPGSAPGNIYGNQWYPLSDEETQYLREIYERVIAALLDM